MDETISLFGDPRVNKVLSATRINEYCKRDFLEEEKKKTTFFVRIFNLYPCVFYSNFDRKSSLDAELNSTSNEYPLGILLTDPATQKQ